LLADIHNRGSVLYNARDPQGCYRLLEGSLRTIQPLLPKELQEVVAKGLADAESQFDMNRKAFVLHDCVEKVRKDLRPTAGPSPKGQKLPAPRPVSSGGAPNLNSDPSTSEPPLAPPKPAPKSDPPEPLPKPRELKPELPKSDLPKVDLPQLDLPKLDLPKLDSPKKDASKNPIPQGEGPNIFPLPK
jgi:hypothetical protein